MRIVLLLLVGWLGATDALCQSQICPTQKIEPTSVSALMPIGIGRLTFGLRSVEAVSWLEIQNKDPRPISAIFVVVNFYKADHYLLSSVFYAATLNEASSFRPAAKFSPHFIGPQTLTNSVLPGQNKTLEASSPVLPAECPDTGRVVLVQAAFSEGEPFESRASGWRVDPWLESAKPWPLRSFPKKSLSIYARLSIDEVGKPHVIAKSDVGKRMSAWLSDQIESTWTFLPATYDGAPIASELEIVFRFFPVTVLSNPFSSLPSDWGIKKVVVVDIVSRMKGRAYEMFYGGTIIAEEFPPRPMKAR